MRRYLIYIISVLFSFIGCIENLTDDGPCGPEDSVAQIWTVFEDEIGNEKLKLDPSEYYINTNGGRSFYQFSLYVPEACREKHAKVHCEVYASSLANLDLTARADYQFFYQVSGQFNKSEGSGPWISTIDFGMKNAFYEGEPAFFWGVVIIGVPEHETLEEDHTYLSTYVSAIGVRCFYNRYVPPDN